MSKTILITGATDGLGLATARDLLRQGHRVLVHGRSPAKLAATVSDLEQADASGRVESFRADLSELEGVDALATAITERDGELDVIINNAGVFQLGDPFNSAGLDLRFFVNMIAPYRLTRLLLPLLPAVGRVINLASAAQAPVNRDALEGRVHLDAAQAYAQSKLGLIMWSAHLATTYGPPIIAVNPGSFLKTNMVREAYGIAGNDLGIGSGILIRAALDDIFARSSGRYFDNDLGQFTSPHVDASDPRMNAAIVEAMDILIEQLWSKQAPATPSRSRQGSA